MADLIPLPLPVPYQRRPKPLLDSPVFNFTDGWDVPSVKSALAQMESGNFIAAAQLADAMDRDDRIAACLDTRIRALMGSELQWGPDEDPVAEGEEQVGAPDGTSDPSDEEGDEDESDDETLEQFRDAFPVMFPTEQLAELLRWGIRLGVGLGELVWFDKAGRYTPTPWMKIWHPQFVTWRWDTRSFWVSTQTSGNVEIIAGDGRWILYTPFGKQRGWMQGLVRKLSLPYLIRQYAMRDSARYSEAYGLPVKQGIVPQNAVAPDKQRFLEELSQLANEATILTPQLEEGQTIQKFDFKMHELSGKGHEVFETQIRLSSANIAIVILGQNMTTEAGTEGARGALATASVHDEVRQDVLEADATTLMECLRVQGLRPWSVANLGDVPVPEARWQTDPPEDEQVMSVTVKTLSDALASFKTSTAPIDSRKLLNQFGIPLLSPEDEAKQKLEAEQKDEKDRQAQVDQATAVAKAKGQAFQPAALSLEQKLQAQIAELRHAIETKAPLEVIVEGMSKLAEAIKPQPPPPAPRRGTRSIRFTKDANGVIVGAKLSGE
jgi:phage gp29-like protein